MHDISRRSLLGALPILGGAFLALPATATVGVAADDGPTLIEWDRLSEITQRLVVADYWRALNPDQQRQALRLMRANGQGRIADALGGAEFSGPGIYEFEFRAGSVLICPVAFLDRAPERDSPLSGKAYRWRHWYAGKFQGRAHYVREASIKIISKREALDC